MRKAGPLVKAEMAGELATSNYGSVSSQRITWTPSLLWKGLFLNSYLYLEFSLIQKKWVRRMLPISEGFCEDCVRYYIEKFLLL